MRTFLRQLKPSLLAMWGGTLLSCGLSLGVSTLGTTSFPMYLWMLLVGSILVAVAGALLFAAALRLETCVRVLDQVPRGITEEDLDRIWNSTFDRHGGKIVVPFLSGCTTALLGIVLLSLRCFLYLGSQATITGGAGR